MKKIIAVLLAALLLGSVTAALASEPDGYVATGGWIIDQQVYNGSWTQAYQQILNNHYSAIHNYQDRTLGFYQDSAYRNVPCKPVGLMDLTGDGTPELLFLETADSESRGDLYMYSMSGGTTRCILYVPGITRLNYDDVGLGFDIFQSSANGGTLVIEYYEYEWPWLLQLQRNALNQYTLLAYYRAEYDNSGEGDSKYYRNGVQVGYTDYQTGIQALEAGRMYTISSYYALDKSFYGLTMDWETAASILNGYNTPTAVPPTTAPSYSSDVYGLTIDKLSTRTGPGTQYSEGGTYSVKGQWIKVLAKAWDSRNGIWWVKCEIPYRKEIRVLWTGWKRFDHSTISLDDLPEEFW